MVGNAIQAILSLVLLIGVGFFLETQAWFKGGSTIFSKYCVNIGIPCYMVYNMITVVPSREYLIDMVTKMPIPLAVMLAGILASTLLAKLFNVERNRFGAVIIASSFANTVLIGFPVIQGLFGDVGIPIAMVYYMVSLSLFWTFGVYIMRHYSDKPVKFLSHEGLKKIIASPPIIGLAVGISILVLGVELPEFAYNALSRIQGTTTPVAMMFIGSIIYNINFKELRMSKDMAVIMIMKFAGLPFVMWAICGTMPISLLHKQVFFSMAALPPMTQVAIVAKECDSDYHFASLVVGIATVFSIVTIPIYAWIMQYFNLFS